MTYLSLGLSRRGILTTIEKLGEGFYGTVATKTNSLDIRINGHRTRDVVVVLLMNHNIIFHTHSMVY